MKPTFEQISRFVDPKLVSKHFGVSERTARRWLEQYNLLQKKPNFGPGKLNLKKAEAIRKAHSAGVTPHVLAAEYKVTLSTIYRVLNQVIYKTKETAVVSVIYNPH